MTLYPGLDDAIFFGYVGVFAFGAFRFIWGRLGGWPEAYYRIRRISYFAHFVFAADGQPDRDVHRWTAIKHQSPAQFECRGKMWGVEPEAMARSIGRPALYYNYDNMIPIPLFRWTEKQRNGSQEITKINPAAVMAAYKDETIQNIHNWRRKTNPIVFVAVAGFAIIAVLVALELYYSYNVNCALRTTICPGGPGITVK